MGREYIRRVESPITSLEIGMRLGGNWLQDSRSRERGAVEGAREEQADRK